MTLTETLSKIVGQSQLFEGDAIDDRYKWDFMLRFESNPKHVVRPSSVEEVAQIVKAAKASATGATARE